MAGEKDKLSSRRQFIQSFPLKKRDTGTQRRIPPRRQCLATVLSILPEKPKNQLVNLQKNLFFRGLFFCYLSLALKKPVGYNNL